MSSRNSRNKDGKCQHCGKAAEPSRLRGALKKLEWIYKSPGLSNDRHWLVLVCIVCGGMKPDTKECDQVEGLHLGHEPDCWLAPLITEAGNGE